MPVAPAAAPGFDTDQLIALWSAGASVVGAVVGVITTVIAGFVFVEARRIRRVEWASTSSANWQSFSRLVLDTGMHDRWSAIIRGRVGWPEIDQRDLMIIYSFLNVLVFEYNAHVHGLLDRRYAERSINHNIVYFRHIWPDLFAHLQIDGWPEDFLRATDRVVSAAPADAPAAPQPGSSPASPR